MLSQEEIHGLEHVNLETARVALESCERRLSDALDVKEGAERKAMGLFTAYTTLVLALSGLAAAAIRDGLAVPPAILIGASIFYVVGAALMIAAMAPMEYGNRGNEPESWLVAGRIDGGELELARMYAFNTLSYKQRIDVSFASNAKKITRLRAGMVVGLIGAVVFSAGIVTWASDGLRP